MKNLHLGFVFFTLCVGLTAQTQITSPAGFLNKEGSSNHGYMLFSKSEMRWQQIDTTHKNNKPFPMMSIAWRRDFTTTAGAYGARTLSNFQLILSYADAATSQKPNLDLNYVGTPTTVIPPTSVKTPSWSAVPVSSPAPFNLVLRFNKPWVYQGTKDFLWEVRYTANDKYGTNYPFDYHLAAAGSGFNSSYGQIVGTSCKTSTASAKVTLSSIFHNHGTKFRLYTSVNNMPPNSTAYLAIDYRDRNTTIAGLCTTLHAMPILPFLAYKTNASGSTGAQYLDNIPHNPVMIGANLFTQAMAVDLGQSGIPVVLSYCQKLTIPSDPTANSVYRYYHYKHTPTSAVTTGGPWYGGIVARFGI